MLLGFDCRVLLLVRQSYVHFFLDKKVPKKSRLCTVFNADWAAKNLKPVKLRSSISRAKRLKLALDFSLLVLFFAFLVLLWYCLRANLTCSFP